MKVPFSQPLETSALPVYERVPDEVHLQRVPVRFTYIVCKPFQLLEWDMYINL